MADISRITLPDGYTYDIKDSSARSDISTASSAIAAKPGEIVSGTTGAEIFNNYANNTASGDYAHAEGSGTSATGARSHAEGSGCSATAHGAHAEGHDCTASGAYSHAEGDGCTATGVGAHAEGAGCSATNPGAHAEGFICEASGQYSHAEGVYTVASANYSHAEGAHTIAASIYQHVQGKYNIQDSDSKYAFIIGNGDSNTRSNAFAIDWDGKLYINNAATGVDVSTLASDLSTLSSTVANLPVPMVFKGTLGTGGTITSLPAASSSNTGFTYKVITAGTYRSKAAKVGDTFISTGSAWELIPSGDEPSGTVTNVEVTGGTGVTITGSPITTSGTIDVSLDLDTSPHNNGAKPITSGAVYTALSGKQATLVAGTNMDASPTSGHGTVPVTSGGVYTALSGKQDTLTVGTNMDSSPTSASTNPVTSGGVYAAISDLITAYLVGTELTPNTAYDLNNFRTPGIWRSTSGGSSQTGTTGFVTNRPSDTYGDITNRGFRLSVEYAGATGYVRQCYYPAWNANQPDKYFVRHYRGSGTDAQKGWSNWYVYEGVDNTSA